MTLRVVYSLVILLVTGLMVVAAQKIDPRLLGLPENQKKEVVVVMKEQADLSEAENVRGKTQKTSFVYQLLVETASISQKEIQRWLASQSLSFRSYYIVNMLSLRADSATIEKLAERDDVAMVIEDSPMKMLPNATDRIPGSERAIEWGVSKINAPQVWALGFTGQNITIGGQDTGYEWDDPVIKPKYRGWVNNAANHDYNWHDAIHQDNPNSSGTNSCGFNSAFPCDDNNHGTHTMGTMVGDDGAGNQVGVAPGAVWIGCRNMENGWGTLTTYVECFEWFLAPYPVAGGAGDPAKMPHVINNSWGCPPDEGCNTSNFSTMETALNNLRTAGCVVVVSAGNSGSVCSTVSDPAAIFEGSLSVGATNSSDAIASFSSRGPVTVDGSNRLKPNVSAPGVSVRSCVRGTNQFGTYSGTSMAGPHVAGAIALLISANPALEGFVAIIEDILEQTALNLTSPQTCGGVAGTTIPNNTFGFGRINVLAAVNIALPSNYSPFVKQSTSLVIENAGRGLIIKNPAGVSYRIQVTDAGVLTISTGAVAAAGSTKVKDGSLHLNSNTAGLILRSANGTFWKVGITNAGILTTTALGTLPGEYTKIGTGDCMIEGDTKGLVIQSPDNTCFLMKVSQLGKILCIPANCP
ncbi:MAG: S8 family serine peptidase [Saprospiraceae bacterium]|jgi:subtilisin family serine protease|nr:S8 family serine peptidase [Saprospiraceae bacterium]